MRNPNPQIDSHIIDYWAKKPNIVNGNIINLKKEIEILKQEEREGLTKLVLKDKQFALREWLYIKWRIERVKVKVILV